MIRFSKAFIFRKDEKGRPKLYASKATFPFDQSLGYKPKPIVITAKNKQDLEDKIRNWEPEKQTLDKSTTLVEYVRDVFIPAQERRTHIGARPLQWSTFTNRRARLMNWLIEPKKDFLTGAKFEPIKRASLGALTPQTIQSYFELLEDNQVSQEVRFQLRTEFNMVFKQAEDLMKVSPSRLLRDVTVEAKSDHTPALFDLEQVEQAIRDTSKPLEVRALVAVQYYTLCRPSEIWALSWADFGDDFGFVLFDKASRPTKNGYQITEWSKNYTKRRTPLAPVLAGMLRELRKRRMAAGIGQEAVFLTAETPEGKRMSKDAFGHRWPSYKVLLGLTGAATFYSLKHLGNSRLDERDVPASVRAKLMGHKNDRMAREVYRVTADRETVAAVAAFDTDRSGPFPTIAAEAR